MEDGAQPQPQIDARADAFVKHGEVAAKEIGLRPRGRREQPEPVVAMQGTNREPVSRARSPTRHVSSSSVPSIDAQDVTT